MFMAVGLILGGVQGILGMGAADQQAAQANMQARAQLAEARAAASMANNARYL